MSIACCIYSDNDEYKYKLQDAAPQKLADLPEGIGYYHPNMNNGRSIIIRSNVRIDIYKEKIFVSSRDSGPFQVALDLTAKNTIYILYISAKHLLQHLDKLRSNDYKNDSQILDNILGINPAILQQL